MISPHFSYDELIASQEAARYGIDNTPGEEEKFALLNVLVPGLELIRIALDQPMIISSGYRCLLLNVRIGGAKTSQHMRGEAADFISPKFGSPYDVCQKIMSQKDTIGYDQLIHEFTWVHVSFSAGQPRGEELTFKYGSYTPGIHL